MHQMYISSSDIMCLAFVVLEFSCHIYPMDTPIRKNFVKYIRFVAVVKRWAVIAKTTVDIEKGRVEIAWPADKLPLGLSGPKSGQGDSRQTRSRTRAKTTASAPPPT